MGFSNPAARRAFFAGKKAKEKELKEQGFTSNPSIKLPDPAKLDLPKLPKFPKITSMMKIPRK